MIKLAVKVAVHKYEIGKGQVLDDHMVCLTNKDAIDFIKEFNAAKDDPNRMSVILPGEKPMPIDLSERKYKILDAHKRMWLSSLTPKK